MAAEIVAQEPVPKVLSSIGQVRALSTAEIEQSPRVELQAVVTLRISRRSYTWIEDEYNGVRLYLRNRTLPVQPGDRVLVKGVVVPGENGPMVAPEDVQVLSSGALPEPLKRTARQLNTFADLDRRVETEGRVIQIQEKPSRWHLELESGGHNFWIELSRNTNDNVPILSMMDATVQVRGICVRQIFDWGESVKPAILAQSAADIVVLQTGNPKPQLDPETLPIVPISSLTRESIGSGGEIIRIQGTVLDQRIGEHLILRDSSGTLRADSRQMTLVPPQSRVDVWGTPVWESGVASLRNAKFKLTDQSYAAVQGRIRREKPDELPVITRGSSLLALAPEEAAWRFPVKLRGVVLLYYPERRQFFVHDESAGFYVSGPWNRSDIRTGDLVEISGYSDPGGYAPMVVPQEVKLVGTAAMPHARRVTLFQMVTGQYDSQWVEAFGVVRDYSVTKNLLRIKLTDTDGTLFAYIPTETVPTNLIDSVVRLRGVCTTHPNANRQLSSLVIWSPSIEHLQIEEAGINDPSMLQVQPIATLGHFRPYNALQRRMKVEGIVTLKQNKRSLFIEDETAGVEVHTAELNSPAKVGDRVIAVGYPSLVNNGSALRDATLEIVRQETRPEGRKLAIEQPLNQEMNNRFVELEAHLNYVTRVADRDILTLQIPGMTFEAHSAAPLPNVETLAVGSRLKIKGIYRLLVDEVRKPTGFQMLFTSGDDIQVLEKPSWWELKHTLTLVGALLALVAVTTLWVVMLRRKVQEQTASLQSSETKFRALVEQSLVGVYIIQHSRFAYVNPRFAEIFGYTAEEMMQMQDISIAICEEDRELVAEQVRRRVNGEITTAHYTFRGLRKDGGIVHFEVLGSRTDFNGAPAVLGTGVDITARKRAEEELFNSRQMLRSVLDTIPQRVFWKDVNSVITGCNKAYATDCGFADPAEVVGKTDFDIHDAEAAKRYQEEDREIIAGRRAQLNREILHTWSNEAPSWLRISKVPLFDKAGNVTGVLGTYEDISERKHAEAALAKASSLLETLLSNSLDYIYFKDRESRFVRASQSLAMMFGLNSADELIGKSDFDLFQIEHAQQAFEDEQEIIRTGKPIVGKPEKETHTNGRITWALSTKLPWRDQDGNIIGTFGISKDVTETKQAEQRLAYEQGLFKALVETLPDAIYFKDRQSRFVRISQWKAERARQTLLKRFQQQHPGEPIPEHLTTVERCAEYLIGKTDFDVAPEDQARIAYEEEQAIIRTGKPLIGHITRYIDPHTSKTAWSHITKMPWVDSEGNIIGTFGVTRDITALKEAEAQLEAVHQRLVETSRLAGMAEVATDVLHNVGNVLNSVNISCSLTIEKIKTSKMTSLSKVSALLSEHRERLGEFLSNDPRGQQIPGYLSALADHLRDDQAHLLKELEQLLRHIDHIKQIVAMQQSYAKVAGVKETISANQLVEDALQINAAALVRHDVHVTRDFQDTPPISTEKHKVLQILVNLIRNAKYAMDDAKPPKKILIIRIRLEDGNVRIDVIDNGVGIPKENLTRIFGHGFTTRRNGHGFGLHSSAIAVKELGGSLTAHSEGSGRGATFTLLLPHEPVAAEPENKVYESVAS